MTSYTSYDDDLQPLVVVENSGATTRKTTTTYDLLGRRLSTTVTIAGAGAEADTRKTSTTYDPTSGAATSITDKDSTGVTTPSTITTVYDTWGRAKAYTDATGFTSTATYTPEGRTATASDGSEGTYTYSYSTVGGEQRGFVTAVDAGLANGPDVFTMRYNAAGQIARVGYPNGLTANYLSDEAGNTVGLTYTAPGSDDSMLGFGNEVNMDGRVVAASSQESDQHYTFDKLGRLTQTQDQRGEPLDGTDAKPCTTRTYGLNATSERTSFASYAPAPDGTCLTAIASSSATSTFDSASRITNAGYMYDTLGRTVATPAIDTNVAGETGASALTASYYANDMVKTLSQTVAEGSSGVVERKSIYALDPIGRIVTTTTLVDDASSARTQYRFSGTSDSPSVAKTTVDDGANWTDTRYIQLPGVGMVASFASQTLTFQLPNLHGDVVALESSDAIDSYTESDEFGNVIGGPAAGRSYGWLGAAQRSSAAPGGLVLMGARAYNPSTGAFLTVDPIPGGGATRYAYPTDPVNMADLDGHLWSWIKKASDAAIAFGLNFGVTKLVAAIACAGFAAGAIVCAGIAAAIGAFVTTMITRVFIKHKSVSSSIAPAVAASQLGFVSGITGYKIPTGKLLKAMLNLKTFAAKAADLLRGMGHQTTAHGIQVGLNSVANYFIGKYS